MLNLSFDVNADYIFATLSGIINKTNADDTIKKLSTFTIENSLSRWLMDVRQLEVQLSLGETFFYIPKLSYAQSKIIALVADEKKKDYFSFFEITANNRGLNIKLFEDMEIAKNWLFVLSK